MQPPRRTNWWWALLAIVVACITWSTAATPSSADEVRFQDQVLRLLREKCFSCHGPETQESGLRLDVRERVLEGGDHGAVLVAGSSENSRLLAVVRGQDQDVGLMPPEGEGTPLTDIQIELLAQWIDQGANWPAGTTVQAQSHQHWSFQPIERPPVPAAAADPWVNNPIDAFVLSSLQQISIPHAQQADRHTLIRRLYLDVLGLPPPPEEVRNFLADTSPDAWERLVDRVLDSPHFGERAARAWLDLARYADSDGYEKDLPRPHAWRYRQWVIDALRADMPYDQFSRLQIAGDLMLEAGLAGQIASGFHRNTLHNTEGGVDVEEDRWKKTVDRTNTVGTIWLGLTVGCAQCHSHKYDPLTQREYYSLYAFFNYLSEVEIDAPLDGEPAAPPAADAAESGNKAAAPVAFKAQVVREEPRTTRTTNLLVRGDFLSPGPEVEAATPSFLPELNCSTADATAQANRRDLADWLFTPQHPLTARVAVNRIWQAYFGRGIVATVDDFGTQGEPPSHPELLDWLASELRDGGWSLKRIHRLILTSATYQQSTVTAPHIIEQDPENLWLARQTRRRVEAEIVRDVALAASGLLDPRIGGPSVRPPQAKEVSELTYAGTAKWEVSSGGDRYRRGLYTFFQRTSPYPMLVTFDAPDATQCTAQRSQSNTPLQALTMWNDPVFVECAQQLARRICRECAPSSDPQQTIDSRIARVFAICLARPPQPHELAVLREIYAQQQQLSQQSAQHIPEMIGPAPLPEAVEPLELSAWVAVSRVMLNLDELIMRE